MSKIIKCLISTLFLLGVFSVFTGFNMFENTIATSGNTIFVDDNIGQDYIIIQDAIDNASQGDTVYVYGGTYYENIEINKKINLVGEDNHSTVIDAGGDSGVVEISSDGVNISNFTLCNGGGVVEKYGVEAPVGWGIFMKGVSNCCIENNIITNMNSKGIRISSSNENIIRNNQINNVNLAGICITSSNKNFFGENSIRNADASGIYVSSSDSNSFEQNSVSDADLQGIVMTSSSNYNSVSSNLVNHCQHGIGVASGDNNVIQVNILKNNEEIGLYLTSGRDNIVKSNTIRDNNKGIVFYSSTSNNIIYHNNIINNIKKNVEDNGDNTWYNKTLEKGNYYSDYDGNDVDGDGIVDKPYNTGNNNNQDLYPLLEPVDESGYEPTEDNNDETNNEEEYEKGDNNQKETPGFTIFLLIAAAFFVLINRP